MNQNIDHQLQQEGEKSPNWVPINKTSSWEDYKKDLRMKGYKQEKQDYRKANFNDIYHLEPCKSLVQKENSTADMLKSDIKPKKILKSLKLCETDNKLIKQLYNKKQNLNKNLEELNF